MAIFDNGQAPITQSVNDETPNIPRSKFDLSMVKSMNGIIGALMPFDVIPTIPNEDYDIGYDTLVMTRNPTVREMLTGFKVYIHTYWCRNSDLWKGWDNFVTKGRNGDLTSEVPKLYPLIAYNSSKATWGIHSDDVTSLTPFAPSTFMGVPVGAIPNSTYTDQNKNHWYQGFKINDSKIDVKNHFGNVEKQYNITALPFVMYNKIYRDYYANKDLITSTSGNNYEWYPKNEDEALILPYTVMNVKGNEITDYCNSNDGTIENFGLYSDWSSPNYIPDTATSKVPLNCLHFRQFKGDYFTTASVFADLLRTTNADNSFNDYASMPIDLTDSVFNWSVYSNGLTNKTSGIDLGRYLGASSDRLFLTQTDGTKFTDGGVYGNTVDSLNNALSRAKARVTHSMLNNLRKAIVLEKFQQRNGATDGTYKEIINAQFGYKPNVHDRKPTYIGGTDFSIGFNTITASANTYTTDGTNSFSTSIGQKASNGYGSGSGYVGKFHSDDYGYIMSIMSIVPDVYYAEQGIDSMWNCTKQEDIYYPLKNNLAPTPILNKEIFLTGSISSNEDVFAWKERFSELKSRRNKIVGLGAWGGLYDESQFMKRKFVNAPVFNNSFVTMSPNNIDMSPFASTNEVPFDIIVGANVTKVSPMPYSTKPMDFGVMF